MVPTFARGHAGVVQTLRWWLTVGWDSRTGVVRSHWRASLPTRGDVVGDGPAAAGAFAAAVAGLVGWFGDERGDAARRSARWPRLK